MKLGGLGELLPVDKGASGDPNFGVGWAPAAPGVPGDPNFGVGWAPAPPGAPGLNLEATGVNLDVTGENLGAGEGPGGLRG